MKNYLRNLLTFIFILLFCTAAFASFFTNFTKPNNDKYIVLDVEGEGANRNEAIEAAWLDGIRQAVGSFIDAKTELNNDQLTERIISYSRGLVEKYEITSVDDSKAGEGVYKIKMRLYIVQELLRDGAKHATAGSSEIAFSPADLKRKQEELDAKAAKELEAKNAAAETAKRKSQKGAELLEAMLNRYKTEDFLSCYIPGKPEIVKGKTDTFSLKVELNFNEKLYKENFIPDLIQVLDQIASVKKNTLLVKYKNELRNLAAKKDLEMTKDCESIILRANELGKDYTLAVYNKPENFGCRLYGFNNETMPKVHEALRKFCLRTKRVKGLLLELLDEDKEVIETIEKKFSIAFLTTDKAQNNKHIYSVQPTILIKNNNSVPNNVELKQNADGTALYLNYVMPNRPYSTNIKDTDINFPFRISPPTQSTGFWGANFFKAYLTRLILGTTYTVTIKEKVNGVSIPNGGQSFTFQYGQILKESWEEKMKLVIPVELELPEEILPVVKNIKASLLIE